MKKTMFLVIFAAILQTSFAQIRLLKNVDKLDAKKEVSKGGVRLSDVCKKDTLLVYVFLPKNLFTVEQVENLINRKLIEVSSQSIVQKKGCSGTTIDNGYLSDCWIKDPNANAPSVVAEKYTFIKNEGGSTPGGLATGSDYYIIAAKVNYNALAPKTALVSVFLNLYHLQTIHQGNWLVEDRTWCSFKIKDTRWAEFIFQPPGACCLRAFTTRGFAGNGSICSTIPNDTKVDFWVSFNAN